MDWSKREVLGGLAGLAGCAKAGRDPTVTPAQGYGPFYPKKKPLDQDADLTRLAGHEAQAKGRVLDLAGRVLKRPSEPLGGARVEIWQANAAGRYAHPGDHTKQPLDPDFQGYGVQTTDAEGRFRFLTVQPGPYDSGFGFMRAAHIHFKLTDQTTPFVTIMYFPGDPWLEQDGVFKNEAKGGAVFCTLDETAPDLEPGATLCAWDIVMASG